MELTATICDIVIYFPQAAEIFDRYNLDYYCCGKQPFLQTCEEKGIDPGRIWKEILKTESATRSVDWTLQEWEPAVLTTLIFSYYGDLNEKVSVIYEIMESAMERCIVSEQPKIKLIYTCFSELADALKAHSASEEITLTQNLSNMKTELLEIHLTTMEHEHIRIGALISSLRRLTANYIMTDFSSVSLGLAWTMLHQFDKELTQRLHLENNILFPKLRKV